MFSTFVKCFQMAGVFYHSVIHSLGFFVCLMIYSTCRFYVHKTIYVTRFFYVLYTCTLILHRFLTNQRAHGPIYIIIDMSFYTASVITDMICMLCMYNIF